MNNAIETQNLAVVAAHFELEVIDVEKALSLYTDDVIWESPARGLHLIGKAAIAENYRNTFSAMSEIELQPLDRFASGDRVVDDTLVRFRLSGDTLANPPAPVGSRVEMRLVHIFAMRDGLISRETVMEAWRIIG